MNLDHLLRTAQSLTQPSAAATAEFSSARDSLAAEVYPFFHWLIVNIPSFVQLSDAQRAEPLPAEPHHGAPEPAL